MAGTSSDTFKPLITATLSVRNGPRAIDFYKAAFGAVELHRVDGPDGTAVAQLAVSGAEFWVSDESPAHQNFSPESLGGCSVRMLLVVEDPDAVCKRALDAGATQVVAVAESHGWRIGRILDPFGHHWEIARQIGKAAAVEPRADLLDVFSKTGHQTLNAFLIVSGGVAASFLAFLGATFREPALLKNIGSGAAGFLVRGMMFFVAAIVFCLVAHGTTFLSHAAFYDRKTRIGNRLMKITATLMAIVVLMLILGSVLAFTGFSMGLEQLRQVTP